jgi:4-hydroxy-2-oxoheptanedioate aldolase
MRKKASLGWKQLGPGRIGTVLAVVAAFGVLVSTLAAQQAGGKPQRINQIIEQFEQGKPAIANEHWTFFTLTNSPFMLPELQKHLASLAVEGARPRMTPIVRIAQWGGQEIGDIVKQLLSQGVLGIIVPEVHTKEQAARLVRAMRWPPQRGSKIPTPVGDRGCCPAGAPAYWGLSLHDYFVRSDMWPLNRDGELLALVMVESREAIKNINEILSVPGLGGVLVGPHDLSLSLGVGLPESNPGAPEVEEATLSVAKACGLHKALCGTFSTTQNVDARVAQGFKLFPLPRAAYDTPAR